MWRDSTSLRESQPQHRSAAGDEHLPLEETIGDRDVADAIAGALGALAWGSFVLGLWSISTADPALLVGWWVGQTVELAVGGHVIGSVLGGARLRTMAWRVGLVLAVGAGSAVALQTIGYATAPVISR